MTVRRSFRLIMELTSVALALLVSFAVATLVGAPSLNATQHPSTQSLDGSFETPVLRSTVVENTFIVSFREYKSTTEHAAELDRLLGPRTPAAGAGSGSANAARWSIIERVNAASQFPTDFMLIKLATSERQSKAADRSQSRALLPELLRPLASAPSIRYVTAERMLSRSLFAVSDDDMSAHSHAHASHARGGSEVLVEAEVKPAWMAGLIRGQDFIDPPPRFKVAGTFHRTHEHSWQDEDDNDSDDDEQLAAGSTDDAPSQTHARRLLQRGAAAEFALHQKERERESSVTEQLDAQKLWDLGHSGTRVK